MEPFTMGAHTSRSDDGNSVSQMRRLNSDPIGRTKGSRLKRMWSRTLDAVVATRTKEEQPLDSMAPTTQTRLSTSTLEVQDDQIDLLEKIGSGGFGDVHKAFWRGTLVACKTIRADMLSEEKQAALEDLKLEVQVLQQLRHPNIMMLLAYKTTAAHQLMISELMACSLLDVLKSGSVVFNKPGLCENLAIRYAIQLSQGMNYLHTCVHLHSPLHRRPMCDPPIMHRDLKPENLLLDHSGTLKVADFGLAKLRPRPMPQVDPEKQMMTGETGSYRYMAPEVFRHEAYDESVDVYSFAMIFFYMVSGRPPFMNMDGLEAVKAAAMEKKRPELPRLRPLSPALAELLTSTWCSEASERLTFDVVLKKLRSYYEKTWNHTLEETMMKEAAEKIASLNRAYGGAQGNEGGCCSLM